MCLKEANKRNVGGFSEEESIYPLSAERGIPKYHFFVQMLRCVRYISKISSRAGISVGWSVCRDTLRHSVDLNAAGKINNIAVEMM